MRFGLLECLKPLLGASRTLATGRRRRWTWALPCALLALGAEAAGPPQPLFETSDPLAVTVVMSMAALRESRRTDEPVEGVLRYGDGDITREFDLDITLRGHSRREFCDMPPLKLNFRRSEVAGSVFANQNKLKLVTHCQSGRQFQRYLQQELAIYQSYGALTENAFRVRPLAVTYVDSDGRRPDLERPAFLIEDDGLVAERLGFEEVAQAVAPTASLAPDAITLFGLFQYMIGNTDWSLLKGRGEDDCCHNGLLLRRPDDLLVIVPYDFDQAGIIGAHYALPAEGLGIRSVRERVFRGLCTGDARLDTAVARFVIARDEVEAPFPDAGPMRRANRRALSYIDDFYTIVNDEDKRARWISGACRGDPSLWDWMKSAGLDAPALGERR